AIGSHSAVDNVRHKDVKILDNSFYNFSHQAIMLLAYTEVVIDGNLFENCWKGVQISIYNNTPCTDFTITKNMFKNINKDSSSRAIQIGARNNFGVIADNVIRLVGHHGI